MRMPEIQQFLGLLTNSVRKRIIERKGQVRTTENRKEIGAALRQAYCAGKDTHGALWEVVIACQGEVFHTASGLPFSYTVRRKKDGAYSGELP